MHIKVTDGVYVAIGFGLANAVLIEGEDGVIIVDTMESAEAAAPVKAAFDSITSKPVKAIIYADFHSDHHQDAFGNGQGDSSGYPTFSCFSRHGRETRFRQEH